MTFVKSLILIVELQSPYNISVSVTYNWMSLMLLVNMQNKQLIWMTKIPFLIIV